MHGSWTDCYPDGTVGKGFIFNGAMQGLWTYSHPNGIVGEIYYDGNGVQNALRWTITSPDGTVTQGRF